MKLVVSKCTETKKGHFHLTLKNTVEQEAFPGSGIMEKRERTFYRSNITKAVAIGTEIELDPKDWKVRSIQTKMPNPRANEEGQPAEMDITMNYLVRKDEPAVLERVQ